MSVATPHDIFGPLFVAVQESRIFADSKAFADALPRRNAAAILADWHRDEPFDHAELRAFVDANFTLPLAEPEIQPSGAALVDHIDALWSHLTRQTRTVPAGSSALPLPEPYVVPGGRFRELYYWDSYFTMLGLARSGRQDLVEQMIFDFGSLIDRYGHIPNGTRSYYLSRSQPPMFYLMAALSKRQDEDARAQRLAWMRAEHAFWMAGEAGLEPGAGHRRIVRLADGSLLNRYWDDRAAPRDESWAEDVALARAAPDRVPQELWRDLRAAAESGWDFSSRWLGDGNDLATIRTTRIVPIDLNSLLYGLERAIAAESAAQNDTDTTATFAARADARRIAINCHLWSDAGAFYTDHDLDSGQPVDTPSAAMAFPLFTRVADATRARATAAALEPLLAAGGLLTTLRRTGQQWDAPNGWAPMNYVAVMGLRAYGETELADDIARRWLTMVTAQFAATGQLYEKYDVERGEVGGGGEYPVATGFGWTNGVTLEFAALLDRRVDSNE